MATFSCQKQTPKTHILVWNYPLFQDLCLFGGLMLELVYDVLGIWSQENWKNGLEKVLFLESASSNFKSKSYYERLLFGGYFDKGTYHCYHTRGNVSLCENLIAGFERDYCAVYRNAIVVCIYLYKYVSVFIQNKRNEITYTRWQCSIWS